ncbi:GFA family protein [Nocardia fusca]|uniref:GFA family protein n=1 Tax=Nocardia fusca TaxID=941183 RepID=A0ABV3F5V2_9NOCA
MKERYERRLSLWKYPVSATGDPDFPHLCSCEHCQKLSGAPVMSWVSFPEEGFAWTGVGGEPAWFETFPQISRGFCPECGSSVASKGDEAGLLGVTIIEITADLIRLISPDAVTQELGLAPRKCGGSGHIRYRWMRSGL